MLKDDLLATIAEDEAKLIELDQDGNLAQAYKEKTKAVVAKNIAHNKDAIAGLDKVTGRE